MDSHQEEDDEDDAADGEEHVVHQRLHEGCLRSDGIHEPLPGSDGGADGAQEQDDSPSLGLGIQVPDHFGQAPLEGL